MASVQAHAVVEGVLSLGNLLISRVGDPSVGLEKDGGTEILLLVPPVRWARSRAAGAENAFIKTVELLSLLLGLAVLATIRRRRGALEVGLDGAVLLVEEGHVRDKVLDDVHVWEWVNARFLGGVGGNAACKLLALYFLFNFFEHTQAGQCVDTIDVHGAATTNTLTAASSESQSWVDLILDPDQSI